MSEHLIGPEHDQVPPLNAKIRKDNERRAQLLDFVHGPQLEPEPGRQEEGFFLPPEQVFEFFKETEIGEFLPRAGERAVEALVDGLGPPGEFWSPSAKEFPDRALLRRSVDNPSPGKNIMHWRRSLGVAFQSHYPYGQRIVTADFEVGLTVRGGGNICLFSRGGIHINDTMFMVSIPEYFSVKVGLVDEFLSNIESLTRPPMFRRESDFLDY